MNKKNLLFVAAILLAACAGAAAGAEVPYGGESNETGEENWTEGHEEVTLSNMTHYISRIGTFVVGDDPTDPGVGPIFVGLIIGAMSIQLMGQSRTGLIASGTMAVFAIAALSAPLGAGFLPRWLYGSVVMLIALIAGVVYIRMMR